MKTRPIVWQRLVTNGEKRPRCADTGDAVLKATKTLSAALAPLGMEPELEVRELDEASVKAEPSAPNCIWIAGKPLEYWLQASVGSSTFCSVCGDLGCGTMAM